MSLAAEHKWNSMNTIDFDEYKNVRYKTQIRTLLVKINDSVIIEEPCGNKSLLGINTSEAVKLSGPEFLFSSYFHFGALKSLV